MRRISTAQAQVCVLGGGPAGAVIARQLATWGHDTIVIHRRQRPTTRVESLAPPALSLLDSLGLGDRVAPAIVACHDRALMMWASASVDQKIWAPEPLRLVDRALFDRRLRGAAADAGARVISADTVGTPAWSSDGWAVAASDIDGKVDVAAAVLVDARGRRRQGGSAARTAALTSMWTTRMPIEETRLEALDDGWLWACPLPGAWCAVTLFVDASSVAGVAAVARTALYRERLLHSVLVGRVLDSMTTPLDVRDATPGIAGELVTTNLIRVGEAAWSLDPLSSHGVHSAMISAVQGAAVVHTMGSGGDVAAAREFYDTRQRHAAARVFAHAARLYGEARFDAHEFWRKRSDPSTLELPPAGAHTRRRTAMPATLRLSPAASVVRVPLLDGNTIVRGDAITHPDLPEPIALFGNARVVPMLASLAEGDTAAMIVHRWTSQVPRTIAHSMMSWLYQVGVLE